MTKHYFQQTFFNQVWPKLGGSKLPAIQLVLHNPHELSKLLWKSLLPTIDQYIEKYNLQINTMLRNDSAKFQEIVERMFRLNQQHAKIGKWYDCWPATAIEKGSTNCSLGSQVLGRTLQQNGYTVEYGMPGPMSHAVIFTKTKDGIIHYLDSANGVTVEVAEEVNVKGIKTYRLQTEDERIPFRLIPVCSLEESVATSIWNLNSLRQAARNDSQNNLEGTNAQILVAQLKLNKDIDYGSWAIDHLLPQWKNLRDHSTWKQEMAESGQRIAQTNN